MDSPDNHNESMDFRSRLLSTTLDCVRERRTRRQRKMVAVVMGVIVIVLVSQLQRQSDDLIVEPRSIERVGNKPLQLIQTSTRTGSIEPITVDRSDRTIKVRWISDEELLAALPGEQACVLVGQPNGASQFIVLE